MSRDAGPVVAAMSGGVDSSVAAALLLREGRQVIGVTLKLQECHENWTSRSCCGVDGVTRAAAAAGALGIAHYVIDCVRDFDEQVLRPVWDEYAAGRTPNPCLLCNERIKFGTLLAWARRIGAACAATGHYARTGTDPAGDPFLLRGVDAGKDQSYFLAGLSKEQLGSVIFPVGDRTKPEVRELARELGLPNSEAPESQDACLVGPGQTFSNMLRERFGAGILRGPVVDGEGRVLAWHGGIHRFTVGQRKGIVGAGGRHWVKSVRAEDATVVVTSDERELYRDRFLVYGATGFEGDAEPAAECDVQVRYRQAPERARVERIGPGELSVTLFRPVRAVTPGQAAVFYDGARVLGRGWIHVPD